MKAVAVATAVLSCCCAWLAAAESCASGTGILGADGASCCPAWCGSCDEATCSNALMRQSACCPSKIVQAGKPCGNAPCVVVPAAADAESVRQLADIVEKSPVALPGMWEAGAVADAKKDLSGKLKVNTTDNSVGPAVSGSKAVYKVKVAEAGLYRVVFKVQTPNGTGKVDLNVSLLPGDVDCPADETSTKGPLQSLPAATAFFGNFNSHGAGLSLRGENINIEDADLNNDKYTVCFTSAKDVTLLSVCVAADCDFTLDARSIDTTWGILQKEIPNEP